MLKGEVYRSWKLADRGRILKLSYLQLCAWQMVSRFKVRDGGEPRLGGMWLLIFLLYRLILGFEVCPHGKVM